MDKQKQFPKDFNSKIEEARGRRGSNVLLWDWSRRMLRGEQMTRWDGKKLRFISITDGGNARNQTVTNQLLPPYRTMLSLLHTQEPKLEFHGASATWENITKAMACNAAASYWWQSNKMSKVLRQNAKYLATDGTCALHTFYDPARKMVRTEAICAYDLLFEANAQNLEESQWIGVRHVYTKQALIDSYPQFTDYIKNLPPITNVENRVFIPEDRLDVWDVYWKDGSGRHGILLGKEWLWTGTTPGNVCPVSVYRFTEVPGEIYGLSMIVPLIDPQRRYNRYRNIQLDIADLHSNPVWVAPTQANVPKAMFNNQVDNVIFYNGAAQPPVRQAPPSTPQSLFENTSMALSEIMDLSGFHPSTTGKRSVGVTSGVAIRELADGDMAQLSDVVNSIIDAVCEQASVALTYWKAYLPEEQVIRYLDSSVGTVVYKELQGTDLLDAPEVFMVEGTLFTIDAQARDAKLLELAQQGIIDADQIKRQLSFKIDNMSTTKKMLALSHARDLLEWCKQGGEIELFPTDDLQTIKDVFLDYINSPEYYEKLAKANLAARMTDNDPRAVYAYQSEMEIQNYIRDVVVSIDTYGQPVEQYLQASAKVFPRTDGGSPQDAMKSILGGPTSQRAQQQQTQNQLDMRTRQGAVQAAQQSYEAIKGTPGISGARG